MHWARWARVCLQSADESDEEEEEKLEEEEEEEVKEEETNPQVGFCRRFWAAQKQHIISCNMF